MYFKFEFSLGKGKKQAATKKGKKVLGWEIVHSQVEMMKKEEKFKTASNYLTAARSWTKFLQREDWTFSEMDSQEVELYQRWLSDKGICLNTISAYLRSLRAMYNRWAEEYLRIAAYVLLQKLSREERRLPNEVLPKVKSANSMIWTWKRVLPWRCREISLSLVSMQWGCLLLILLT